MEKRAFQQLPFLNRSNLHHTIRPCKLCPPGFRLGNDGPAPLQINTDTTKEIQILEQTLLLLVSFVCTRCIDFINSTNTFDTGFTLNYFFVGKLYTHFVDLLNIIFLVSFLLCID